MTAVAPLGRLPGAGVASEEPVWPCLRPVAEAADGLPCVSLDDLGAAGLLDRLETKFVLPAAAVPAVLRRCAEHYRVLEVAGRRLCRYRTIYLDTADLALYHAHHAGRLPRLKVRLRSYVDSDTHFLEAKRRTNTGRTVKSRVPVPSPGSTPTVSSLPDPLAALGLELPPLRPVVSVACRRLTLVAPAELQRVTVDVALELSSDGDTAVLPGLAIVEVKQARRGTSPILTALHALGARQTSISKYCVAVALLLATRAKWNHYRPILRLIHKVSHSNAHLPASR